MTDSQMTRDVVTVAEIRSHQSHWQHVKQDLESRDRSLQEELRLIERQIQQIDGAIQACDVFLQSPQQN